MLPVVAQDTGPLSASLSFNVAAAWLIAGTNRLVTVSYRSKYLLTCFPMEGFEVRFEKREGRRQTREVPLRFSR